MKVLFERKCPDCGKSNYEESKDSFQFCTYCNHLGLEEGRKLEGEELREANENYVHKKMEFTLE